MKRPEGNCVSTRLDHSREGEADSSLIGRELWPWVEPEVTELPPLRELTLQSGIPGAGNTGGGGSTVF